MNKVKGREGEEREGGREEDEGEGGEEGKGEKSKANLD